MSELVTVIIPVYKVQDYLNQCINSVVEQTYRNLEIILIDDGSSDSCAEICNYWANRDDRILVVHKNNGGLSSARNAGLDVCCGDYIAFIDSDDWVEQEYISTLYKFLVDNKADICSSNIMEYYEDTGSFRKVEKKAFVANSEDALMKLYNQNEYPACSCTKLFSAYIWKELRFPIGRNYEDAYTTYLTVDMASKVVHISDAQYYYRLRPNSIMTAKFTMSCLERANAWKANYLFCREKYPQIAPYARMFWLEHIPALIVAFPQKMTEEEKKAKIKLKCDIWENLGFIICHMPPKKMYYQIRGLFFL